MMKERPEKRQEKPNLEEPEGKGIAAEKDNVAIDKKGTVLQEKDAAIQDLVDNLQRLQAEFENYKKRLEQEQQKNCEAANEELIASILPVLDQFELALASEKDHGSFYRGIELIYASLFASLVRYGLAQLEAAGKKFDPRLHEALLTEASDKEEGTILEDIQRGYLLHGRVIRHAKVKIAKKGKPNKEGTAGPERGGTDGNP